MLKRIIGGISVGIANVIPGVSGGTMMVLMGIFDGIMEAIPGIVKKDNPKRKEHFIFLFQVGIGVVIGLIGFAKILEYLFEAFPTQTMYWFIGLVGASIPVFMKKEMIGMKIKPIHFIIGIAIIFGLEMLNPKGVVDVTPAFPPIDIGLCGLMVIIGVIGGFSMFLPGVSGSMVLLILGYYYLFKSYLANVTSFQLNVLIPLGFMFIGVLAGIFLSAKLLKLALDKDRPGTLSFLLGLIAASTIVLLVNTFNVVFDLPMILSCGFAAILGIVVVVIMDYFVE
ncbi:MAG: DUF368 domain-containing protein [Coprobacillus sp.]